MDVVNAADHTCTIVRKHYEQSNKKLPKEERMPDGKGVGHALWLLDRVMVGEVRDEKAHRWLGWAQAILTYEGVLTLEGAKYANLLS